MKTIFNTLEKDHKVTLQKLGDFDEALKKIRYEGKMGLGKNVIEVNNLVNYFTHELEAHMKNEERILFPFLQKHIPRFGPMVYLLLSEHDDFRRSLEGLRKALKGLKTGKTFKSDAAEKICEQGTYLICLLRSHMWVESHSLYKAADKELRASEKLQLLKQILR